MPKGRHRKGVARKGFYMNIVIPSFGRSDHLKGADYFKSAIYIVPESQRDQYAKKVQGKRVIAIPEDQDGCITRKRNWILKNIERPLIMIDDDVQRIGYFEGRRGLKNGSHKPKSMDPELLSAFFNHSFEVADQFGSRMWGLNQNEDNRTYKEFLPFSLSAISLGPFQGHLEHDLFFDKRVGTKDDYDMALQQLQKYKILFRWNKYHYICEHGVNAGGIVSYRKKEKEIEYCRAIMKKWGRSIIKYELPPKKMTDLLNAKFVKIPISGV